MMRMRMVATVVGGVFFMSMPAMAQDEAEPAPVRVDVAEAGISLALPADWNVDVEMREREDWGLVVDDDDEPLVFWKVLYASAGGRPWCDLTWYPVHPMTLEEHALLYEALMTPTHAAIERPIEVDLVDLPVGEAYRVVIYNEPTNDWTVTYLLDSSSSRYLLQCVSDDRNEGDWLAVAEGVEPLSPFEANEDKEG